MTANPESGKLAAGARQARAEVGVDTENLLRPAIVRVNSAYAISVFMYGPIDSEPLVPSGSR